MVGYCIVLELCTVPDHGANMNANIYKFDYTQANIISNAVLPRPSVALGAYRVVRCMQASASGLMQICIYVSVSPLTRPYLKHSTQ